VTTSLMSADDPEDSAESDIVDHRIIGARLRPQPSTAVIEKSIAAGVAVGLPEELAEVLAHSAANQQQLRSALRSPKVQRFGTEEFTYVEFDVLTWRIVPSPDNIRFEGEHARGAIDMPRFGAVDGKPLLHFEMASAEDMINAMGPRINDMVVHNPHVPSIQDRGIETPGWLSFLQLTTEDVGSVIRLESTDGFGRTVATHDGLGITFKDAAWNLRPGSRRAASLLRDLVEWANSDIVTDVQARKVRCSVMPNARVIIDYSAQRSFDRARRRFVAHLHMAPPMNFSFATTLNAKANAAVDNLYERKLLPVPDGMTAVEIRGILDGSVRDHDLFEDEVAVLACGTLNPHQNKREARAVNEAITDLTGAKPKLEERTQLAAEVALRPIPNDKRLTALRSALERSWRWAPLRGVALTRREPLELLSEAIRDLVQTGEGTGSAIPELVTLASYHLVSGPTQLLTRSEYGRGDNTEPGQILRRLAKSDAGLKQLCQIILDGRAGRDPQELPDDTEPKDRRFRDASVLTPDRLRELAEMSEEGISHDSPEDSFAAAIADFEEMLDKLHEIAKAVADVADDTGVALVDTVGFETSEVNTTLQEVVELVSEWRSTKRRATRMRPDLDGSAVAR
jgi:predicted translin family RNA/ssDNA-binding protein